MMHGPHMVEAHTCATSRDIGMCHCCAVSSSGPMPLFWACIAQGCNAAPRWIDELKHAEAEVSHQLQ